MQNLVTRTLAVSALLCLVPLTACESSSGNGTTTPKQTNSVDATVSGSASAQVQNEQANPAPNVFGAGVAGGTLSLWITGQDGTFVTVIVDTEATPIPATVTVGEPTVATAWVTMSSSTAMIYNTFDGSGTITINQCPAANGAGLTGTFNNVKLKSELDGSEVTLDGSFNLLVGAYAGGLTCKSEPVNNEPDVIGGDDSTGGSCTQETCDGPCCPYVACQTQCAFACVTSPDCMGGDGVACNACVLGCWDECDASAACISAIDALASCAETHGCDTSGEDTTCAETHCCSELQAAY